MSIKLKFKKLTETARIPSYAHDGDSGMDICSDEDVMVHAHTFKKIRTGIAAIIPEGYELQVRPRSGLAAKQGVRTVFGTVDSGYRGDIGVTLFTCYNGIEVHKGDRIAQLVLAPVVRADIEETDDLGEDTERGTDGFGSTGVK